MHVRALDPVPLVRHMIGADMCRVDERDDGLMGSLEEPALGNSTRDRADQDGSVCTVGGSRS